MNTPTNPFKAALARGDVQIGLWLGLADAYSAELCATAGFDWVLIDGEHGPNDLRSTLAVLQAVAPYPSHPVVRVPHGETALLKQVLDLGAQTVLVPMVESAEQAAALVRAVRYPPRGVRGVGAMIARSGRWNLHPRYVHDADAQVCLLVQVESAVALDRIEAIAAVDGVDGLFIGPADLSASMGHAGNPGHPAVAAAIDRAIGRIAATGKAAGIISGDEALQRRYLSLGVRFLAVGADVTLLAEATRALARRFKAAP